MGSAVGRLSDVAVVTSDNPRSEDPQAIIESILPGLRAYPGCETLVQPDRRDAIFDAVGRARAGDVVLIAGKGHETYQIIGECRMPFDDVVVAEQAVGELQSPAFTTQEAGAMA
jgi:UDP-N-acetylmuramoyl-L-alanyl-D-glutamate--2,6-diaminopimelate ligase